jgi:HPt (histidine-containing phosphotransfer) domain-containing protein
MMMIDNSDKSQEYVDLEFIESRRPVGEGFIEKLVEVFSEEAPKIIAIIKEKADKKGGKNLAELGHKLKGMSLNVGATRLSKLGGDMESFSKANNSQGVIQVIKELDEALEITLVQMHQLTSEG